MNKTPRIAIVDDSASVREALDNLLRSWGYETCDFASADAYLANEAGAGIDCVISDVQMPGVDGLELLRRLKAQPTSPPIIMITALGDRDIESRALAGGAVACLRKPFDAAVLIDTLIAALDAA